MPLGGAYSDVLQPALQTALETAGNALIDQFFEDICTITSAGNAVTGAFAESYMAEFLPRRYLARYTTLFAKRFLVCLTIVTWKLAQPQRVPLSCVGEQLALRALIRQAELTLARDGVQPDFGAFRLAVQTDHNLEALFDDAKDGIEVAQEHAHLAYPAWFSPLSAGAQNGRPDTVHPYLEGGDSDGNG